MCGICGIVNADKEDHVDKDTIIRMRDVMVHRGPDDEGLYASENVGFGFRRLSIVDLVSGHQPMTNEDKEIWLIFNGEIYNHQDLRRELISKGHQYRTKSDTESILHLYEEEGIEGFKKMNGMFGIAIWDNRKRRLILVRDRLGIKPLYYVNTGNNLIFASEIKSIIKSGKYRAEVNTEGLEEYFIFRFLAGQKTMFKGINSLLPGHILIYENGKIEISKFWDLPEKGTYSDIDGKEAVTRLGELLDSSVEYRLMSDVPLGTFCSGGVDSSLTTAYASRHIDNLLNTFSVGFEEKDFDEREYALLVSRKFGTKHHTISVDNKTFADYLPRMIWHNDEPLNHANSVQIYLISKLAKEFVTVVLTGEGSDELFGGYPRYIISKIYSRLSGFPLTAKRAISGLAAMSNMRRLNKLAQFLPLDTNETAVLNSSFISPSISASILARSSGGNYTDERLSLLPYGSPNPDSLTESILSLDLKTYLVSILNRQDKMSMAASVEARVPFLDHRLVEWASDIPLDLKIKGLNTKIIVKRLSESVLPREIIYRKKSGFGVPLSRWFRDRNGMGRYLSLFDDDAYARREYLKAGVVRKLVDTHISGKADYGELLWELVSLELWHRIYIENEDVEGL